jgi:hypothetical protein
MKELGAMANPILKSFTPENTIFLMVDYSVGFVNSFRSGMVVNFRPQMALSGVTGCSEKKGSDQT